MEKLSAGMGSVPGPDGTTFRVWAPNANAVFVLGSFNDWVQDQDALELEGDGYWAGYVEGARPGDEYKFAIETDAETLLRVDPYALAISTQHGNALIHEREGFDWLVPDNYRTPAFNEMVIYELHLGTFTDPPGDGQGGFESAIERLEHLQRLGINVIELMPPTEFPGMRSWGYNPTHPFAIESDYGGPDGFKQFIKAAHELGIAVIMDVVYNHLGPTDLPLWRYDGWSDNEEGGGIYFYNDWRRTTPWGDTRPDYGRPQVRNYLRDNALNWLEMYRIDGLRWDATAYIANVWGGADPEGALEEGWGLMRWINDEINERQPWKVSIAEDLRSDPTITMPTSEGGAGFDAQWDAIFVHPVRAALSERDDSSRDMTAVAQAIDHRYGPDAFSRVIYTESHDEVANGKSRVPEEITPGEADSWFARKRSTLGAALVFTSPGVPMIFQGQELLEDRWFSDDEPIDWNRLDTQAGVTRLYRDLIELRRNMHGTSRGLTGQHVTVHHVNEVDKMVAFHRWADGGPADDVVVVANFADQRHVDYEIGLPSGGTW
ncbi:MAG: alpha amylase C-terminal domain-containing protein, partial [Acidimicrobiia bacterium]|nr:alpha amylase C-terminal domain-containing protein [Acidimicrobiia bacterium]